MSIRHLAVAALVLAWSAAGPLRAQELTCDDIEFDEQARSNYSLVDQACLGVVETNGVRYARFHGKIIRPGKAVIEIRFEHNDGSWGPIVRTTPPEDFRVVIDGRPTHWSELSANQELHVYLREGRWEVAMVDYDEPEIVEEYVAPITVVSAPVEEEAQETAEPAAETVEPAAEAAEEEAPAEPAPESGSRTLLWILGIMALLIIVMIVRRRRA
jgi:hypothetical protein